MREVENRGTGERIVFRRTSAETDGELLEMDDFWARPDHQTPEHVHPKMEERWQVIVGSVGFRIDGVERIAGPGDIVVAPAGAPHTAWNAGGEPIHLRIQMSPALRWQEFVERLFSLPLSEEGQAGAESSPLANLLTEFRREVEVS